MLSMSLMTSKQILFVLEVIHKLVEVIIEPFPSLTN
jgi:hypothetical protein